MEASSSARIKFNFQVVLDIRHTKDIADIDDLLVFRIAMVPKTWNDKYNDPQTTTGNN
jgi:hypothetical protein